MKKFVFIVLSMVCVFGLKAQNVQITASVSQAVVEVGEQFELNFSVNAEPTNIAVPDMRDFRVLYGPTSSTSSSTQINNGKVTQSFSYTYGYVMQATKPGKYIIGAAEATVAGKKYKSNAINIEVVGSAAAKTQQAAGGQASSDPVSADGDLFLRVSLDKKTVYQGEYITATVKLYTKLNVSGLGSVAPTFNGFFQQELAVPQIKSLQRENLNGVIYGTALIKKYILIPQKSGTLTIDALETDCNVQKQIKNSRRSPFDDFFGPQVQEVQMKAKSKAVSVVVKPLPANAPDSYNGAVGKFTFDAKVDKTSAKTNDAISLKVTVSGNGNIKLLDAPKINFPPDFDSYDPKVSVNTNSDNGGISGTKVFEYLLIPRNPGEFTIAPVTFSYFDVIAGEYKTLSSKEFNLSIAKGIDGPVTNVATGLSKEDLKFIGKDILYIKTGKVGLRYKNQYFFGSILFYSLLTISFLLFVVIIWMRRRSIRENSNVALVRNRRANKFASKRLKQASIHLKANEKEKFYDELLKGLWGYLSDKLNIPLSELSRDKATEMLTQRNVDNEIIKQFVALADNCEFARFAPQSAGIDMNEEYNKAIELISKFQNCLK